MTSEQFDQLVNRIQAKYGSRPLALRLRIAFLVGLGYGGFLAVLLLVLVLSTALVIAALISGKEPGIALMAIVAVLMAFGICQALVFLWIPMESDPARELTRADSPQLFELLDTLQSRLGVAPFDHVRVTSEFNASVQMIPRLGAFGFNRNYLYLGLPMMRALSAEHYSSVLAHEFAHYSSRHDRFGTWIYRLRQTWRRVFAELHDTKSTGAVNGLRWIILPFVDWFWPRFNAYAFVLARADEYEADRVAAEWAGTECMAEALFRIDCIGSRLHDRFWPDVTLQARNVAAVPDDILARMQTSLAGPPDPADAARWLTQAAQTLTGNVDTHPSLSDRLKSLSQDVSRFVQRGFPSIPTVSAADVLIGEGLPQITRDINQLWQKDNTLPWQNVYHQARRLEKQLGPVSMSGQANQEVASDFDVDRAWQQARTVSELQGMTAAEQLFRQVLEHRPSHALANLTLGRHLLERGQSEGEQFLRRILEEEDSDLTPVACEGLIRYFQQQGESEKLREARSLLSRFQSTQVAASKERNTVTASDTFISHGLSDDELASLINSLSQQSQLGSAWLARKQLQHFRKQRLFVLTVQSKPAGLFGSINSETDCVLAKTLIARVNLPGRVLVVSPQGGFRTLAKKVMSLSDSRVFPTGV